MIELDTRELAAPEPFQVALSALVKLERGEIIHFKHRMVPMMLMPRLREYYFEMIEDDEVDIYICHKNDKDSIDKIQGILG